MSGPLPGSAPFLKSHIQITLFCESGPLIQYWVVGMVVGIHVVFLAFYANASKSLYHHLVWYCYRVLVEGKNSFIFQICSVFSFVNRCWASVNFFFPTREVLILFFSLNLIFTALIFFLLHFSSPFETSLMSQLSLTSSVSLIFLSVFPPIFLSLSLLHSGRFS